MTDYEGCIQGLKLAQSMGIKRIMVFRYVEFIIHQTIGLYTTKELHLLLYHRYVIKLAKEFDDIVFQHIPRN